MGDVAKGAKIFKTKCAQCHVVGAGMTVFLSPHSPICSDIIFFRVYSFGVFYLTI